MKRTLMKHQVEGVKYWLSTSHPALIWEMRTGKTLTAIRGTQERDCKHVLVNGPINIMDSWEEQLAMEGERYVRAYACSKQKRIDAVTEALSSSKRTWVLMNYEGYRSVPQIADIEWDTVIADESVKLKNPHSKTARLFIDKFRNVKHRAILTGLIAPESELDLFMQFMFLHGKFMSCKSYWTFRSKYFEPGYDGFTWKPLPGMREQIKQILHMKASVLRRADADLEKKKIYSVRTVQMNARQRGLYRSVDREFRYELEHGDNETVWATEKAIWLSRIAGGFTPDGKEVISTAKPDEIIYLLKNDLKGESVIIWYRFLAELHHDVAYFRKAGFKVSSLHGQLVFNSKTNEVKAFKSGETQILCCMEKLGDKGKDFSIASTSIYRSNEYSCDLRGQSEDRILHPLKMDALLYIDLLTEDTIDEEACKAVRQKVFNAREMMSTYLNGRTSVKETLVDIVEEIAALNPAQPVLGFIDN